MVFIRPTEGEPKGSESYLYGDDFGECSGKKSRCTREYSRPYRKPTQVLESSRLMAYERPFAKELGNTATVTSG